MPILQMRRRAQEGNSGTKPGFTPPASSDSPETDIQTLPLLYSCPGVFVNPVTLPSVRKQAQRGERTLWRASPVQASGTQQWPRDPVPAP